MELLLVHPGKAYLPELRAYRRAFSPHFQVREVIAYELDGRSFPGKILYFIMGFYPGRYEAHRVVHDYRSLSVGAFPGLKDSLKRGLCAKPDLRIFANGEIERRMSFADDVPTCRLDMGVHLDLVTAARAEAGAREFDLCYVGDVSAEREAAKMLRGFVERAEGRRFALAGEVDRDLRREYGRCPGVEFLGRLPLSEAYRLIAASETGVCYLPPRRPYSFQTPVKVLEYAALGLKVVVNDTTSNVSTLERHGIEGLVKRGFEFPTRQEVALLADNRSFDPARLGWERMISESGLLAELLR